MLSLFVGFYLLATLLVGFWASRKVTDAADFAVAGRRLGLGLSSVTLFATWYGSETILGASAEYMQKGFLGIIEEPLGAVLALLVIGIFFALPLYRMQVLTFGDFFRIKYGKWAELVSSLIMVFTYFGWIAAQFVALGIVLQAVTGIPKEWGILVGALIVFLYTFVGGMWAVSITDLLQSILIISGLIIIATSISQQAGGLTLLVQRAEPKYFTFLPKPHFWDVLQYIAAWMTLGLGSIPSQDVFQRIMSSKSAKVAVWTCFAAAGIYLIAFTLPLIIALSAAKLYPELLQKDLEMLLPQAVMLHSPLALQILFFGALVSAIMSTASGAILAPATVLAENIFRHWFKDVNDSQMLNLLRFSVAFIALLSLGLSYVKGNIIALASLSATSGLVTLFVPIWAGLYWGRFQSTLGAMGAMFAGLVVWISFEVFPYPQLPAIIPGVLASLGGMVIGNGLHWAGAKIQSS